MLDLKSDPLADEFCFYLRPKFTVSSSSSNVWQWVLVHTFGSGSTYIDNI